MGSKRVLKKKGCKDCGSLTRKLPHPGPRCVTCHRLVTQVRTKAAHESRVQKTYGLGPGDYDRLYEAQDNVCAICRRATGSARRLSVDHDHKTGTVRGLLCRPCNDMLGHLKDDPSAFERAARYLRDHPAAYVI